MKLSEQLKKPLRPLRKGLTNFRHSLATLLFPSSTILLYHRVANVSNDPRQLSVSPENFRAQLTYLSSRTTFVPLSKIVDNLKNKKLVRNETAITFDDGYADNLYAALPILEEFGAPATIYVTAGMIGSTEPFPWDIDVAMNDRGTALTVEELRKLASHPLITIGAHTMTHPRLSTLSPEDQKREIEECKRKLEEIIGKKVAHFAYPFGGASAYTDETVRLAVQAGFESTTTSSPRRVFSWSHPFKIPRLIVRNWNSSELPRMLKGI